MDLAFQKRNEASPASDAGQKKPWATPALTVYGEMKAITRTTYM
jgi:hypothetical protein